MPATEPDHPATDAAFLTIDLAAVVANWRLLQRTAGGTATAAVVKADVIIAKQRHGPIGTVTLQFEGILTKFSGLAEGSQLPEQHF